MPYPLVVTPNATPNQSGETAPYAQVKMAAVAVIGFDVVANANAIVHTLSVDNVPVPLIESFAWPPSKFTECPVGTTGSTSKSTKVLTSS